MRYVWTVEGDDPDFNNGDEHGIDGYFYSMRDPMTTAEYVKEAADRGYAIGLYMGHDWFPGYSPAQLAAAMNAAYIKVTKNNTINLRLKVMFNMEEHNPAKIANTAEAWRALRKYVGTSWSPEGFQGGWMGPRVTEFVPASHFVQRMLAARIRIVPQAFTGDMTRRESDAVLRNVVERGFPQEAVSIFYDAAQLGRDWDGFAFTMGRLPWLL